MAPGLAPDSSPRNYEQSLAAERRIFDDCHAVHDLPGIFHYWSETHLQPKALRCGFEDSTALFAARMALRFSGDRRRRRFCSLGSGNGDLEIELARRLRAQGRREFTFDCIDLNTTMRDRALEAAEKAGVAEHFRFLAGDLNHWQPADEYDAFIANQSLHHIVNLEPLFDEVKKALRPDGTFLISDMIGRNGHQRWPEALAIIQEYWKALPPSYRVNRRIGRYEHEFQDWDCSTEGFEGVRSQDILPLLVERFDFHLFFPFGNLIDPFIDRAFGPNFDPSQPSDRDFIDRVQNRDTRELASGHLKPTHLIAVAGTTPAPSPIFADGLTPRFCVRHPALSLPVPVAAPPENASGAEGPLSCGPFLSTPARAAAEARKLAVMISDLTVEAETWKQAAQRTGQCYEERTAWALALDSELNAARVLVRQLESELAQRTDWALALDSELKSTRVMARQLQNELEQSTAWADRLERELADMNEARIRWAQDLEKSQAYIATLERRLGYLRRPWKAVLPLCRKIFREYDAAAVVPE